MGEETKVLANPHKRENPIEVKLHNNKRTEGNRRMIEPVYCIIC